MTKENIATISANQIASGDTVFFPRIGPRKVKSLYSVDSSQVTLNFEDGKTRTLPSKQQYKVILNEQDPVAGANQLFRFDKNSNRTSVISPYSFHNGFDDVTESFRSLSRGFIRTGHSTSAIAEVRYGAVLHTEAAMYWVPTEQLYKRPEVS